MFSSQSQVDGFLLVVEMAAKPVNTNLSNALKRVALILRYFTGFACLIITHALLALGWLSMYLLRAVAIFTSRWISGMGKPLSWKDVFLLEAFEEKHRNSIVATFTLDGDMSSETLKSLFVQRVLLATHPHSTKLKFPELKQFQTKHLGFCFWKDDPDFNVGNHIKEVFQDEPECPKYFRSYEGIYEEMTGRPYPAKRSPWEFWVVRNFRESATCKPTTVLTWRTHHSMMDGLSIVQLLVLSLGQRPVLGAPKSRNFTYTKKGRNWLKWLAGVLDAYYKLQKKYFENMKFRRGICDGVIIQERKVTAKFLPLLEIKRVKEVAAKCNVTVPSLLVTLIMEGIANAVNPPISVAHPVYVLPLPKHSEMLSNRMAEGSFKVSVRKGVPILTKLQAINKDLLKLKTDPLIGVVQYSEFILGHCFPGMAMWLRNSCGYTPCTVSNYVVGSEGLKIGDLDCIDMRSGVGPMKDVSDSMVCIVGYKEHIQVLLMADNKLLSEQDLDTVAAGLPNDLENLQREVNTSLEIKIDVD